MTPVHEEMRAACSLFEIPQLYAAFLHLMLAGRDLVGTDTTSKGSYAPTLFTVLDTSFQELAPSPTLGE